ncbi:MAG: 4'-phosphopantetheinyl transferase superfamily protein [Chitinophagaceae bacterium]|jgi:phosphopantetheinyl transferase|nr:4'-phosphopantetheinyl transferase superfamily protein [Chitinophagaceae bacterium]
MPLLYQQNIDEYTRLAVWKIEEDEDFFLKKVPVKREISHLQKRLQHIAGRYLLSYLFPCFPAHEIKIAATEKPYLPNEIYHFSISHCSNMAAAIVSKNKQVGIDIERFTDKVFKVQHKFLNEKELTMLENISDENEKRKLLTTLWCTKETVYKWQGLEEVDFKKNILITPFSFSTMGSYHARFSKEKNIADLEIHYRLFDDFCLSWTCL